MIPSRVTVNICDMWFEKDLTRLKKTPYCHAYRWGVGEFYCANAISLPKQSLATAFSEKIHLDTLQWVLESQMTSESWTTLHLIINESRANHFQQRLSFRRPQTANGGGSYPKTCCDVITRLLPLLTVNVPSFVLDSMTFFLVKLLTSNKQSPAC